MKILSLLLGLGLSPFAAATELLTDFQLSSTVTFFGPISHVRFSSNEVVLKAGVLAYHPPGAMREFRFPESVWIVGYKTEIVAPDGKAPDENFQCHSFLGDQVVMARQDQEMRGIFSDAYTQEVRLPEGYGLFFAADEPIHWMTMFNNREDSEVRLAMVVEISVIRDKNLNKPLQPLHSTTRSVKLPPLFWVPPGKHQFETTVKFPFNGRIHFIGSHVHPHAESMELFNVSRHERVWKGYAKQDGEGELTSMEVYSSQEGYSVRGGEDYRIVSVYDNPTSDYTDAMAGMFIFYSLAK